MYNYDDAERWSICQTVQYFIGSNTDVLHVVTVKYSLQQSDKTVLHYNDDSPIIHRVLQRIGFDQSGVIHIKTFSTLSGVRTVFLILLQLDIFAQVQWNDMVIKRTIYSTRVIHGSKKNLPPSS